MDHAGRVRGDQRVADLQQDRDHAVGQELALVRERAERAAFEPLHHDVEPAIGELAGLEDIDDVRVTDAVDHARFGENPLGRDIRHQRAMHHLQRGALADLLVRHAVHRAHATAAELSVDHPRSGLRSRCERVGVPARTRGNSGR